MTAAPAYLADTNVLIYLLGGTSEPLRRRVEEQAPGAIVTSTLCVAEALSGARRTGQQLPLRQLLATIAPLPFDMAGAGAFPRVPVRRGRMDRMIAAHALALDLTIVTDNEGDFADVADLRVENWTR